MIGLYTDFGNQGPYIGQMMAAIDSYSPHSKVINIQSDLPSFDTDSSSILLAAYHEQHGFDTNYICVVDPGVGSHPCTPVVVFADCRAYIGPNNGIFDRIILISQTATVSEIVWTPDGLSTSAHGRDLFAPVAAMLDSGSIPDFALRCIEYSPRIEKLSQPRIVYIDRFGNCVTGIFAEEYRELGEVRIGEISVKRVNSFVQVDKGEPILYENSFGLLELAVNHGRADEVLGLKLGSAVIV
jgi:S-adenosylmethionine hydrolase